MAAHFVIEVKNGSRIIERIKFSDEQTAWDAYDELETRYSRRGYTIEFKDTRFFR